MSPNQTLTLIARSRNSELRQLQTDKMLLVDPKPITLKGQGEPISQMWMLSWIRSLMSSHLVKCPFSRIFSKELSLGKYSNSWEHTEHCFRSSNYKWKTGLWISTSKLSKDMISKLSFFMNQYQGHLFAVWSDWKSIEEPKKAKLLLKLLRLKLKLFTWVVYCWYPSVKFLKKKRAKSHRSPQKNISTE